MRFNYSLEIREQDFTMTYHHMNSINNFILFMKKKNEIYLKAEEIKSKINKKIFLIINTILDEPLMNSIDSCKDNYLNNPNFIGKINITIIINTKRKTFIIILKDNGAGTNASNTIKKRKNPNFIGGKGIGLSVLTKKRTDSFRLERDYNGATIILRKKYDNP